jgi:uncharacterized membrane protein
MTDFPLIATQKSKGSDASLNTLERSLSGVAGVALLINAFRQGGVSGALQAVVGVYSLARGVSGRCPLKQALTPTPFERQFSEEHGWPASKAVTRSVTINRPFKEVREFVSNPCQVGKLLSWVDSVEELGPRNTRWAIKLPGNRLLHCDLLSIESGNEKSLHWETAQNVRWHHDISLHLKDAPAGRGTEVKAVVVCQPSFGRLGYAAAKAISVFSDKAILNLLLSIKQQLETGEVAVCKLRPEKDHDFFYIHDNVESAGSSQNSDHLVKTGVAIEGGIA